MTSLRQIRASAGSGKTFELTSCFLRLLTEYGQPAGQAGYGSCAANTSADRAGQCAWGDILAATFTNAAATEMRERVISTLKGIALGTTPAQGGLDQNTARHWVGQVMRDLGALNIRTIDSLLHLIVRSAALELGLHPDFQPVFASAEAIAPYLDKLQERAWRGDKHLRELLRQCCDALVYKEKSTGFVIGEKLVSSLHDLLDDTFRGHFEDISPAEKVKVELEKNLADCVASAGEMLRAGDAAHLAWNKNARKALERLERLERLSSPPVYWQKTDIAAFFHKGTIIPPAVEQAFAHLRHALDGLQHDVPLLRDHLYMAPFVELARLLVAEFRANWSQDGSLPGLLVPQLAKAALEGEYGVPDALCRLGSRLTHYLLDEFQDTSDEQWQALRPLVAEALSRGGSLTWVGDVKQSIYGWRQGNPELFNGILEDTELLAPVLEVERQALPCNWRSREEIIRHTNRLFAPLADTAIASAALSALLPEGCPESVREAACQRLTLAFAETRQSPSPKTQAGGFVAADLIFGEKAEELRQDLREKLVQLVRDDLGSRRTWAEILVLTRTNSLARDLAEALVAEGIPVITENSLLLAEHPLVVQSIALLSFLHDPDDAIALWAMLTGSIVAGHPVAAGLDWHTLNDWILLSKRQTRPLWQRFRDDWPEVWQKLLAPFFRTSGLMTPYDTILEWYALLDVEARFPQARTFLRRFMEVVHSAEEKGLATLSTFLEHWQAKSDTEKIPMPENMDAVRIMTIHKSKGLEAPVVIVPNLGFAAKAPQGACVTQRQGLRLVSRWRKELGKTFYQKIADDACENLDLLYVALTRAREELYIFQPGSGCGKPQSTTAVLDLLWQTAGLSAPYKLGSPPMLSTAPPDSDPMPCPPFTPSLPAADWRLMHWLPNLKIFRNPLASLAFKPEDQGQLLHLALENLHITGKAESDAAHALDFAIAHYPAEVPNDVAFRAGLHSALTWFAALPQAEDWIAHGLAEQPLLTSDGAILRVDLLVQSQDGPLVIDYKSGQPHDADVRQMRRYLKGLDATAHSSKPARGLLIYLMQQCFRLVTVDSVSDLHGSCTELLAQEASR